MSCQDSEFFGEERVNNPAPPALFCYPVSIENLAQKDFAMNEEPQALIGFKRMNGQIDFVYFRDYFYPGFVLPKLLHHYNDAESAKNLVAGGGFLALQNDILNICFDNLFSPEKFHCVSFAAMQSYLASEGRDLYLYIWAEGEWTCAKAEKGEIIPYHVRGKQVDFMATERETRYPLDEWIDKFFSISTAPPKVPVSSTPRLSKEDWLRQNYPEMSELPKWRFPSVAG
jgi:hypothetical protein